MLQLPSRVHKAEEMQTVFDDCRRDSAGHNLHMAFIDFNDFKSINDIHGHQTGNFVIERVVNIILENIRSKDRLVRYGGDEFALFMPKCTRENAEEIIKRLYSKISQDTDLINKINRQFTVSIGCTRYDHDRHGSCEQFVEDVDVIMYAAKTNKAVYSVVYVESTSEIDVKKILTEREACTTGLIRRRFFAYMMDFILIHNHFLDRSVLAESLRMVWRKYPEVHNMQPYNIMHEATTQNYRNLMIELSYKNKMLAEGRLSKQEMEAKLAAVLDSKAKFEESQRKQQEEERKLKKLNEDLKEARSLEDSRRYLQRKKKADRLRLLENERKALEQEQALSQAKAKKEAERAAWAASAVARKQAQINDTIDKVQMDNMYVSRSVRFKK